MRLIGKAINSKNGYPFFGVVTLLKDSAVKQMRNGKLQWKGFGSFEAPAKGDQSGKNTVSMTTGLDTDFAGMLIDWPKGTRLLVGGFMQQSDFWTQKRGQETFELVVEFIHDQHNYRSASEPDTATDVGTQMREYSDYDPGF